MTGWEKNKGLFWKALGVVVALGVVWGVCALVWGSARSEVASENERFRQELHVRSSSGMPAEAAVAELDERLKKVRTLRAKLKSAVFSLDGDFKRAGSRLDFDQLAKKVRDSVSRDGPPFTSPKFPLGFDDKLLREEGEEVQKLLRRLGAVKRLVTAARRARVASVRGIKHEEFEEGGEEGVEFHRTVVPFVCVFDADERSLVALLHDLMSSPGKTLVPVKLGVKVEERTLGTFRVEARFCAIFMDEGELEAERPEPSPKAKISPVRY